MKLSNTMKHISIGSLAGAILGMNISLFGLFDIAVFSCIVFAFGTIAWEAAQHSSNKIDSIIDVIAGNIGFNLLFWLVMWFGGYWV